MSAMATASRLELAHLSDVHLSPVTGFGVGDVNIKRSLGLANWLRKRSYIHRRAVADLMVADALAHGCGHVAITGDLINLGLPGEHAAARQWLDGVGPPQTVSAVPGNHDIYCRLRSDPGVERWRPFMADDALGAQLSADIERAAGFPWVRCVGPAALIGLNSAVPTPPFRASGALGAVQLAALGQLLDRLDEARLVRVVLIHHPPLPGQAPPRRALADAEAMADCLRRHGAELVLHGHNHVDSVVFAQGPRGPIPVVGIASASAAHAHGAEPTARWNLLEIAGTSASPRIVLTGRGLAADGLAIVQREHRMLSPA